MRNCNDLVFAGVRGATGNASTVTVFPKTPTSPSTHRKRLTSRSRSSRTRGIVEVSAFHVTFLLDVDNVHFYYHEYGDGVWEAGGHTSSAEIARHDADPVVLRQIADVVAADFVLALEANLLPR